MHPITVETIARQRMAERHAQAERHRAGRASRAARRDAARRAAARAEDPSLWGRLRVRLVARVA